MESELQSTQTSYRRGAKPGKMPTRVAQATREARQSGLEVPTLTDDGAPILTSILAATAPELKRNHQDFYDVDFVGKTFPFVASRLIGLLSKPGDKVYDPMLGSGTTLFEGHLLGRVVAGSDINPDQVQSFVSRWMLHSKSDLPNVSTRPAQNLAHIDSNSQQLVIMSYPWLNNWYFGNDGREGALDVQGNYKQFLQFSINIYKEVFRILKPGGYVCNILGDSYNNGVTFPLTSDIIQTGRNLGYRYHYLFFSSRIDPQYLLAPFYRSALNPCVSRANKGYPFCIHEEIPVLQKPFEAKAQEDYLGDLIY